MVAGAALLAIPGGASAAVQPNCSGKLGLNKNTPAGPHGVTYSFKCDRDFQAYAIVSSKKLDYFTPDPVVFEPGGDPSSSDKFACEGPIPGDGFGCPGVGTAGNSVVGMFATVKGACDPAVRAWVTVTFQDENAAEPPVPFTSQTHPFALKRPAGCPKASTSQRAHRRHRAHHRAHRRH